MSYSYHDATVCVVRGGTFPWTQRDVYVQLSYQGTVFATTPTIDNDRNPDWGGAGSCHSAPFSVELYTTPQSTFEIRVDGTGQHPEVLFEAFDSDTG